MDLLVRPAGRTSWTVQLNRPAERTSWTDQLDIPAGQTSWMDQFFLFEALASVYNQRFSFQFVHCRTFQVRWRPCYLWKTREKGKGIKDNGPESRVNSQEIIDKTKVEFSLTLKTKSFHILNLSIFSETLY